MGDERTDPVKVLKERFNAALADARASLERGDLAGLANAIQRERSAIEQFVADSKTQLTGSDDGQKREPNNS